MSSGMSKIQGSSSGYKFERTEEGIKYYDNEGKEISQSVFEENEGVKLGEDDKFYRTEDKNTEDEKVVLSSGRYYIKNGTEYTFYAADNTKLNQEYFLQQEGLIIDANGNLVKKPDSESTPSTEPTTVSGTENTEKKSWWDKFKDGAKAFGKGAVKSVTKMFTDEEGNFSLKQTAKTVGTAVATMAVAGALVGAGILTAGAATAIIIGAGVIMGGAEIVKGVSQYSEAENYEAKLDAIETMGEGTGEVGIAMLFKKGVRRSLGNAQKAGETARAASRSAKSTAKQGKSVSDSAKKSTAEKTSDKAKNNEGTNINGRLKGAIAGAETQIPGIGLIKKAGQAIKKGAQNTARAVKTGAKKTAQAIRHPLQTAKNAYSSIAKTGKTKTRQERVHAKDKSNVTITNKRQASRKRDELIKKINEAKTPDEINGLRTQIKESGLSPNIRSGLSNKLNAREKSIDKLARIEREINASEKESHAKENEIINLRGERNATQSELETLRNKNSELLKKQSENKLQQNTETAQNKVKTQSEQAAAAGNKQAPAETGQSNEKIKTLDDKINELNSEIEANTHKIKSLQEKETADTKKIGELREKIKEEQTLRDELKRERNEELAKMKKREKSAKPKTSRSEKAAKAENKGEEARADKNKSAQKSKRRKPLHGNKGEETPSIKDKIKAEIGVLPIISWASPDDEKPAQAAINNDEPEADVEEPIAEEDPIAEEPAPEEPGDNGGQEPDPTVGGENNQAPGTPSGSNNTAGGSNPGNGGNNNANPAGTSTVEPIEPTPEADDNDNDADNVNILDNYITGMDETTGNARKVTVEEEFILMMQIEQAKSISDIALINTEIDSFKGVSRKTKKALKRKKKMLAKQAANPGSKKAERAERRYEKSEAKLEKSNIKKINKESTLDDVTMYDAAEVKKNDTKSKRSGLFGIVGTKMPEYVDENGETTELTANDTTSTVTFDKESNGSFTSNIEVNSAKRDDTSAAAEFGTQGDTDQIVTDKSPDNAETTNVTDDVESELGKRLNIGGEESDFYALNDNDNDKSNDDGSIFG